MSYSPFQFAAFRVLFGSYLVVSFAELIPYGTELFSDAGMLPDPSLNAGHGLFPNVLAVFDEPVVVTAFLCLLAVLALLLTAGIVRRVAALLLWYGWACLADRNVLLGNPSLPFVGWLLLACAVIPRGEPALLAQGAQDRWQLPAPLFWGAWLILGAGYTISGLSKLHSPSWIDGSAVAHVLAGPLLRSWWPDALVGAIPSALLQGLTWGTMLVETFFGPLCLWSKTRPLVWCTMILIHLGILTFLDLTYITMGILMMHVFTFDARWVPSRGASHIAGGGVRRRGLAE